MTFQVLIFVYGIRSLYLNIILMGMFTSLIILSVNYNIFRLRQESLLVALWIIFSVSIGTYVYGDKIFSELFRVIYFCGILFILFNCVLIPNIEKLLFNSLVIAGYILALSIVLIPGSLSAYTRLGTGISINPNELGYCFLFAIFGSLFLLLTENNYLKKTFFFFTTVIFIFFLVQTASMKTFIVASIFIFLSIFFVYLNNSIKTLHYFVISIIALILILRSFNYLINNTHLGERLQEAYLHETRVSYFDERMMGRGKYYAEGIRLYKLNPIIGLGIGNYRNYYFYSEDPSHSEYVSIFVETGLIGALLYFSVYLIVFFRLNKLRKNVDDEIVKNTSLIFQAIIIAILIIGFGRWNYDSKETYIMMAVAGNFALYSYNRLVNTKIQ